MARRPLLLMLLLTPLWIACAFGEELSSSSSEEEAAFEEVVAEASEASEATVEPSILGKERDDSHAALYKLRTRELKVHPRGRLHIPMRVMGASSFANRSTQ